MTGMAAIFLALTAGWLARPGRPLVLAVVVPYLAICAVQTIGLATGHGVNPPDTVRDASYWIVQALILAITWGAADQVSRLLHREPTAEASRDEGRRAVIVTCVLSAVLVAVFYAFRPMLDPGSVAHHTGTGNPPWVGLTGIGLTFVLLVVLGARSLVRRQTRVARS